MLSSARNIPLAISTTIKTGEWHRLNSINAFCDALFGHFWAVFSPIAKMHAEVRVIPLLEGRVSGGKAYETKIHEPVQGRVLEVGAGVGNWVDVFLKINTRPRSAESVDDQSIEGPKPAKEGITKIFGVEPQVESVAALRRRVQNSTWRTYTKCSL